MTSNKIDIIFRQNLLALKLQMSSTVQIFFINNGMVKSNDEIEFAKLDKIIFASNCNSIYQILLTN